MALEVETCEPALWAPKPVPEFVTFEEFLEWMDEDTCAEWVDGKVVQLSPPSLTHQHLAFFLSRVIADFADTTDLGVVLPPPFVMRTGAGLPAREPDLIFVSTERLGLFQDYYLDGPADLAVEIVSPSRPARDKVSKYGEYERGGVREYWVIDLLQRQATFNALGEDGAYRPIPPDENGLLRSRVLAGVWFDPNWFWRSPLPKVRSVLEMWNIQ